MNRTVVRLLIGIGIGSVLFLAVAYGLGYAAGYLSVADPDFADRFRGWDLIGSVALGLAAMAVSFVIGAKWMRSIDEAAQEAHKSAWYWGGTAGMAVGGVLLIASFAPSAAALVPPIHVMGRTDPAAYAALGAAALMTLMVIGYTIVWAWWWLGRR